MSGKIKTSLKSANRVQRRRGEKKSSLAELNNRNNKITKQYC